MTKTIIADAGLLIAFANLNLFEILPSVIPTLPAPDSVIRECLFNPNRPDAAIIQNAVNQGWINIHHEESVSDIDFLPATAIAPLLQKLQSHNYHYSPALIAKILELAGERTQP